MPLESKCYLCQYCRSRFSDDKKCAEHEIKCDKAELLSIGTILFKDESDVLCLHIIRDISRKNGCYYTQEINVRGEPKCSDMPEHNRWAFNNIIKITHSETGSYPGMRFTDVDEYRVATQEDLDLIFGLLKETADRVCKTFQDKFLESKERE